LVSGAVGAAFVVDFVADFADDLVVDLEAPLEVVLGLRAFGSARCGSAVSVAGVAAGDSAVAGAAFFLGARRLG
jgi:hypothetical protein